MSYHEISQWVQAVPQACLCSRIARVAKSPGPSSSGTAVHSLPTMKHSLHPACSQVMVPGARRPSLSARTLRPAARRRPPAAFPRSCCRRGGCVACAEPSDRVGARIASGAHAHCTCYIPTTASFHSPGQSVTRVSRLYVPSGRGGLPMASFRRQLLMLSREAGSGKSHGKSTGGRVGRPRTVRATALRVCDGPGTTQMVN